MITNLEYLLVVNAAAGRMLGDRLCYPIVPWVSDLTRRLEDEDGDREDSTAGWRDLTMTKFRLRKGDAQVGHVWRTACGTVTMPSSRVACIETKAARLVFVSVG